MAKKMKRRKFSDDQRKAIIVEIEGRAKDVTKTSLLKKHDLSPNVYREWMEKAKKEKWDLKSVPSAIAKAPASNSNAEVQRLREENQALKKLLKAAWG